MVSFDGRAKRFDTQRRKERAGIIANHIRNCIPDTHMTAMEFGCGTGLVGMEIIDHFSSITFVDSSKNMIGEVEKKILRFPNAEAIHIDLTKEIMHQKTFDCIFNSMVLHHIEDIKHMLNIFYSLLNQKGCIIIIDLNKDDGRFHAEEIDFKGHNGFEQTHMSSLLKETGFSNIKINTFYRSSKEVKKNLIPYSLFIAVAKKV